MTFRITLILQKCEPHYYDHRLLVIIVGLQNISQMFVVPWSFKLLPLVVWLLSLKWSSLFWTMILHRSDSLFFQVFIDLSIIHSINSNSPPQLLELFIYRKLCCPIVVENNFLFVLCTSNVQQFICKVL